MTDEFMREAAIRKARALRFKRPLAEELNLSEMQYKLGEMLEACGNVRWYCGAEADELADLLGEDDAQEFEMSFAELGNDIERLQEDLEGYGFPEEDDVNDYLAPIVPASVKMYGYDAVEGDYVPLDSYEREAACRAASERLIRKTKKELIALGHDVLGAIVSYMAIKYRFDSLSAAADVLMERSEKELRAVKTIDELYERAEAEHFREYAESTVALDRALRELPDKIWLE